MEPTTDPSAYQTTFDYGPPTRAGTIPFTPPGSDRRCKTAYWLWGEIQDVAPLIVLHGGPGAPGRDLRVLAALHRHHGIPVLLYDQIGCGLSSHLRDLRGDVGFWTDALFLAELDNLRAYFQIESFHLFGHSCGGILATLYALQQPKGLRKLILASCAASDVLRLQAIHRQRHALPPAMQDAMAKCEKEGRTTAPEYEEAEKELGRLYFCRLDPWPAELHETMALHSQDDTVSATLYGEDPMVNLGPRRHYDPVGRLGEITEATAPGGVLLTNGKYDLNDDALEPLFRRIRARVKWVRFAESAHMAHLEENGAYLETLGNFLTIE